MKTPCEHALSRILSYLQLLGETITPERSIEALKLVEDAYASGSDDIFRFVMERLPQRFSLPPTVVPASVPPVQRGSIGYGAHR